MEKSTTIEKRVGGRVVKVSTFERKDGEKIYISYAKAKSIIFVPRRLVNKRKLIDPHRAKANGSVSAISAATIDWIGFTVLEWF